MDCVRKGKIELLENLSLSEGARVLVTVMPDEDEQQFWIDIAVAKAVRTSRQ